ncbi:MAG: autotransporter outer membrane beta-barrel domain-containing protein [Planctomycetota bacterium]|nr:autotransporter outer membrane beta-barrel domain-containing protein [Planctomycetota bacterium]
MLKDFQPQPSGTSGTLRIGDLAASASAPSASSAARGGDPVPPIAPALFSTSALASLNADRAEISPEPPPWRGVVRVGAGQFREERQLREWGQNVYKHDGLLYSLGIDYDLSINSTVGASVDIIDSTLKSLYDGDSRENTIWGYVANAVYRGSLFGVYPIEAKAFYGSVDHKGYGDVFQPPWGMLHAWKEGEHQSKTYGFSARIGVPLLFLDRLKVLPEAGVRYTTLTTNSYTVETSLYASTPAPLHIPQMTSRSIAVPISVTAKVDFPRTWGIVTPRAGYGIEMEFDETAGGVHALNSAAASRVQFDPMTMAPTPRIAFDPAHDYLSNFTLGLDVKTVGGWEISAEYRRTWAEKYSRDDFKMEIGRCF